MERIPVAGPWVTDLEVRYVADAAANGWYERAGEFPKRFEEAFAKAIGVRHAIAVPHCTAAIHLGLAALGIGPGDEVIVPESTWIASAAPVQYVGGTTIFADVEPDTWCISAESIRACITPRTKAIIPVDLYGLIPDMPAIRKLCDQHGIVIIEDAAQSLGSKLDGRSAGTFGEVGTFSFHGTKTLTTGEGGMYVTDRDDLHERALVLRDHGRTAKNFKNFYNTEVAFKYRMSSLQAAFGLAQLERLSELVERKRQIFRWYEQRLRDLPGVTLNVEPKGAFSTFWMVTIVLDSAYRHTNQTLMAAFDERKIDTRPFFHPLSSLPAYSSTEAAAAARARNRVAYDLSPRALNLPSAMKLTEDDVDRVCTSLKAILGRG